MVKKLLLMLLVGALFSLQFADCMPAMAASQQSMKCCASMPCTPANQNQGCCKTMNSPRVPNMLPTPHAALHAPLVAAFDYTRTGDLAGSVVMPLVTVEAAQHSPPELYTLHASLLI